MNTVKDGGFDALFRSNRHSHMHTQHTNVGQSIVISQILARGREGLHTARLGRGQSRTGRICEEEISLLAALISTNLFLLSFDLTLRSRSGGIVWFF
jgi:hypothetical protein